MACQGFLRLFCDFGGRPGDSCKCRLESQKKATDNANLYIEKIPKDDGIGREPSLPSYFSTSNSKFGQQKQPGQSLVSTAIASTGSCSTPATTPIVKNLKSSWIANQPAPYRGLSGPKGPGDLFKGRAGSQLVEGLCESGAISPLSCQPCAPEVALQTPKPRKIQRHEKVTQK